MNKYIVYDPEKVNGNSEKVEQYIEAAIPENATVENIVPGLTMAVVSVNDMNTAVRLGIAIGREEGLRRPRFGVKRM